MRRAIDGRPLVESPKLDVLVYGSCVSRDLVALASSSMRCVEYIARQSWVSAASEGSAIPIGTLLDSKFQLRNVEGDICSDALNRVEARCDDADILLMDIVDDRFGVLPFENGYITPTAEFGQSGLAKQITLGKHVPFGTDAHFDIWSASAARVQKLLLRLNIRAYVLQTPFTDVSIDRSVVAPALGRGADDWNRDYARYFDLLRDLGFFVIELPEKYAVTTPYHIWGKAPFHYLEHSYRWMLERIGQAYLRGEGQDVRGAASDAR